MNDNEPNEHVARLAAVEDAPTDASCWSNVLSDVVIRLCAKREVITNTEVIAQLREIAEDEGADRLVRDGAGEALKRLMGKPAAVRSD